MDPNELEQSVLQSARKQLAPSAADRMRNQAKLLQALAPPPAIGLTSHSGLVQRSSLGARFGSAMGLGLGLVLGLAVGGVGGFTLGKNYAPQAPVGSPHPVDNRSSIGESNDLDQQSGVPWAPTEEPLPSPVTASDSAEPIAPVTTTAPGLAAQNAVRSHTPKPAPRRQASGRRSQSPPSRAAVRSTLAAELAMLKRARRALEQSNAHLALGLVKSLDEQFEHGMLLEEREATRILTLCQLDRMDEAKERTTEFLRLYPRSVYEQRVASSCGGL